MTILQPQNLEKKDNHHKTSSVHIEPFWSLLYVYLFICMSANIYIDRYIYIQYLYLYLQSTDMDLAVFRLAGPV